MKRYFAYIIYAVMLLGCGQVRQIPVQTQTITNYRDSLILRDSTVIIPIEVVKDVVPPYDTLKMETTMAKASAWVDTTTHTLKGMLTNKQGTIYKYKDREKIVYRDSIVTKEVPVEVEKIVKTHYPYEKWLWILMFIPWAIIAAFIYLSRHPF